MPDEINVDESNFESDHEKKLSVAMNAFKEMDGACKSLVCATDDNCDFAPNPDQMDIDGNGIGDVCDAAPPPPFPELKDLDGDGFLDIDDNCPGISNPDQMDADGNGVGDACDIPPDPGLVD